MLPFGWTCPNASLTGTQRAASTSPDRFSSEPAVLAKKPIISNGSKLELRQIGDEGDTPWCPQCQRPLFDQFSTCIIALVVNDREEAAILRKGQSSPPSTARMSCISRSPPAMGFQSTCTVL